MRRKLVDPALVLSLPEEVTVAADPCGDLILIGPRARMVIRQPGPALRNALYRLVVPGEVACVLARLRFTLSSGQELRGGY